MARLPDETALGPVGIASSGRPIATFDTTGYARGAAAMAEGAAALGKGLETAATNVDAVARHQKKQDDELEVARAKSDFLTEKVKLDSTLDNETDHETLPGRYTAKLEEIKQKAASRITDPRRRELFTVSVADDVARGNALADKRANTLWQDATVADTTNRLKDIQDAALKSNDPEERKRLIETGNDLITSLAAKGVYSEVDAIRAKQNWAHQYATAVYSSRVDSDPEAVFNELRSKPGSGDDVTNRIIAIEGSGKNGRSSATGTGQFIDSTWLDVLKRNRPDLANGRSDDELLALRADRTLGRQMTEAYRRENAAALEKQGLTATPGAQYLAHFLGAGGAAAVLKADPNMPVQDALAKAVGPEKAKQMVDANPTILQGQLAGSVKQWADGKMGGTTPGGGGLYDMLRPDVREQLLARAEALAHKRTVDDLTDFKARIDDSQAEAARTGTATNPLQLSDFIGRLGAGAGPKAYAQYKAGLDLSRDIARVASLEDDEQSKLLKTYEPKPGEGYADQAKRQEILSKAIEQERKLRAKDPEFKRRLEATIAEAGRTGKATNPIGQDEFERRYGKEDGARAFASYSAALRLGRDVQHVGELSDEEQTKLLQAYAPGAGADDYVEASKRYDTLVKAVEQSQAEKRKDPAAFAIARLPAVRDAYDTFANVISDPTATPAAKQAAARDLATKMDMEQARIGVPPEDRRLVPKFYADQFNAALSKPQTAGGTVNVVGMIENEARLWGDNWPRVYRDMAKDAQPLMRVIGAGVKPAAAQILAEIEKTKLGDVLKDQDTERSATIKKDVLEAFKPLAASMAGNEGGLRAFNDFRSQGEKLAAYYVMGGMASADAATKAFDDLVGFKYDFTGRTYRVPKDIPFTPAQIADGVAGAKSSMDQLGIAPPRDTIGGLSADYLKGAAARAYARDGVWVTAPDESGLALIYKDQAVRRADGKPLVLSWPQLVELGRSYNAAAGERAIAGAKGP